jgi:hypothetical protein
MSVIKNLRNTLEEYDFNLHQKEREENGIYYFGIDQALLFFDSKENKLGISFVVFSKPEVVANTVLILSEVEGIEEVEVLDSFIFTNEGKFIDGEEAHMYYQTSYIENAKNQLTIERMQMEMLKTIDESKFGRC